MRIAEGGGPTTKKGEKKNVSEIDWRVKPGNSKALNNNKRWHGPGARPVLVLWM